MTIKVKTNHFRQNIIFFMVSIILVLSAESVWLSNNPPIFYAFALVVLGCAFLIYCLRKLTDKQILLILGYWLLGMLYMFLKGQGSMTGWVQLGIIFPVVLLLHFRLTDGDELRLLKMFVFVVSVLALISLILWLLGSVVGIVSSTGTLTINWGGSRKIPSYYNLYFETQGSRKTLWKWKVAARNSAIFTEAPVASFVFSLALLLNVFLCKLRPKICNTLLVLTILSTYSTTGYITMILIAACLVVDFKTKTRAGKVFKGIVIIVGSMVTIYLISILISKKMMIESGNIRVSNLKEEFESFFQSMLIGHGFGAYTYGSSNSVTALLGDGGIVLWGFYYFPIVLKVIRKLKKREIDYFTIVYVCMFAVTVLHYTIISIFMSALFWRDIMKNSK